MQQTQHTCSSGCYDQRPAASRADQCEWKRAKMFTFVPSSGACGMVAALSRKESWTGDLLMTHSRAGEDLSMMENTVTMRARSACVGSSAPVAKVIRPQRLERRASSRVLGSC
jgi:hypothetical protein